MSENKQQFETDIVIDSKSQDTVFEVLWHFHCTFTANSLFSLLMKEF